MKFIRFAQIKMDAVDEGVVGIITNHSFIDNPTFRGMRQSLMKSFDAIYVLDLHGSTKKKEVSPDGSVDQNVFDIQQGVVITLFIKGGKAKMIAAAKGVAVYSTPTCGASDWISDVANMGYVRFM